MCHIQLDTLGQIRAMKQQFIPFISECLKAVFEPRMST